MFDYLARGHRNRDDEARARRLGAEGYLAVVLSHYRLAYREAHAGALARLLGGEERREEAFLVLGRDADAGVLEGEGRAGGAGSFFGICSDAQGAAAAVHRVERVHDHVDEDLLELIGVAI